MAKGFSFEEALQPTVKGFSFEEALPPEPTLSPEEQVASQVGQGTGETVKDLGKLTAAGAVRGILGAPEAIQSGLGATARETAFAPTDVLNLIADPRMLANKLAGSVGIPPVFEEKKFVPEKVTTKQKAAVDEILTKGKIPQLKTLTEYGNKLSEDIENTVSPEMKLALAESQPTGNILKALETGDFSEVSFGKNPTLLGLSGQAAKVFGSAAPAFLTAAVTKKAGPAAAVGFGQAGAEGVDEARNYIGKMSDDELTKKSEYFRNLVALGYSPKEAREMTVNKAGDTAALYQGTVGALGGVFTSKLLNGAFDKTLLASAKSRLGKIAQGTALGATEGGLSEMAEGVATDLGIDKSVVREIGVDSFANLVLGALGEGAPGTVRGAIAPTESKASFTFEQAVAPEPTPVTPAVAPPPAAAAPVTPPVTPPTTPIGQGEFETPETPTLTPVRVENPTFDEWRTSQGLMFGSKEEYEAALPKLQAQYEAEISGTPTPATPTTPAQELTGADKKLDNLIKGKDEFIKIYTENKKVSPAYAAKAYDAELEYTKALTRAYEDHPNPISQEDLRSAFQKHKTFFNKLKGVSERQKAKEVVQEPVQVEEPVITPAPVETKEQIDAILAKNYEDRNESEEAALEQLNKEIRANAERIEAPPFKKGWVSQAKIEVAPFNGGYVGGSSITNNEGGYASGPSPYDDIYPTKQEAINAEIDKLRKSAKTYGNTKAISWLDSIDPRTTKEGKIQVNKARQAEKKAKVEKPVKQVQGPVDTSGVNDLIEGKIKKVLGWTIYKRKEDPDFWYVQSPDNHAENKIGSGDDVSTNLDTARARIEQHINDAEYEARKAKEKPVEVKPKIEEIVSPQVAASMKDIEFQNKLIKANKEQTITKNQFSRLFKLYQDGKTPQANEQLTKMLAQNEKKAKKEEPEEEPINLRAEETPRNAYEKQASDDYNKVVDESYDGKKNDTDVLANQSLDRYIPFDKLVDIINNAENVLLAPEQLKMRFGVQKAADAQKVIEAVRKARTRKGQEAHIEGKKSEPITTKTIEEAIDKAESNVDSKKIKAAIKNQFDQAIKRAKIETESDWSSKKGLKDEEKFVTIDVPGDGKFKVKNNKENLEKLQKRLISATTLKVGKAKREAVTAVSVSSPDVVLKNMIEDKELDNAFEYVKLKDLDPAEVYAAKFREIMDKEGVEPAIAYAKENKLDLNNVGASMVQREALKKHFGTAEKYNEFRKEIGLPVKEIKQPSIEPGFTKTVKDRLQEIHDEKISEYSRLRRRVAHLTRKVAEGKVSLGLQRELTDLLEETKELKQEVKLTTPKNNTPEHFYKKALDEYTAKNISRDVLDVVKYFYDNNPAILNGIKLSVRQTDEKDVMGNFAPLQRMVTLYKGMGALSAGTARHEIMHSLEQMMNSDTRIAVIESWRGALENAIKQHADDSRSAKYFNAVLDFINIPNETNFKRAVSIMPSKDFYQYINPSEYWAVNAEKLMAAQMGGAWAKFVKFVKSLGERLKAMFGLENDLAIHKTFNDLIKNGNKRLDKESLTSYLNSAAVDFDFLNDIKDVDDLLDKHNRSDTPLHPSGEVKDTILGGYQKTKKISAKMAENPLLAVNNMTGKLDRAITYARNKNVWYGSGLDQADFAKYNGELRNSQGLAVASVAVTNAIHAGHVATQVMVQGKLTFDPKTQMFRAEKDSKSLANVVTLKHDLEEKLGAQRAANVVNAYFEAKRSRSIVNEYLNRSADYEAALEAGEDPEEAAKNLKSIEIAIQKVNMDDEAIDDFISLEKDYPELQKMMENWTAVNQNMLDMMEFAGVISKKRAEHLRGIKDYVPWYRIMDDQTDVHLPAGVRGMTNVGQEKKFKAGEVDRDIDDIVDNMIHNVMMMTRNSMKNYANNRIAMEYATRNEKGKIRLYPTEGSDANGVRVNLMANGRRVIVNIPDPLIAEASLGMENIDIPMVDILAFFAQGLRRGITTNPVFQVSQMFMDAPTAAWVSGVKNPIALMSGTFGSFIRALKPHDPIVDMLKSYGIGGYQSSARTPEKEMKLEIGLLDKSVWAKAMKTLDHIGDASDYAQRRSVYKRVLAETGDEMQALIQANNVIDFLKRGSGKGAQFVTRTVSFMNAYAQSIDVLATALAGGGLKGKSRKQAQVQMLKTGMLLAGTTLLYCMAVGADDEYDKLDDQTKIRNIIIPGTQIRLPMHTSASFFFKSIPELIYNKVMKEGTKNQVDWTRLKKALGEAAVDSLLGPNMIPTGVKPVAEIALNHNFFTGGTLTPKGMEKLESFRQYNNSTSEFGKVLSGLTMGALNPIEADHLVRGLFGTAGAVVMYGSNLFNGDRVSPQAKDNPIYGSFILPEVPRGREDLFYDLKERSDKKYETFVDLMKKQHPKEAQEYRAENKGLIAAHGFVTQADADLKRINAEIRRLSDLPAEKMSSEEKRARITKFQNQKNNILEQTIKMRLRAEL